MKYKKLILAMSIIAVMFVAFAIIDTDSQDSDAVDASYNLGQKTAGLSYNYSQNVTASIHSTSTLHVDSISKTNCSASGNVAITSTGFQVDGVYSPTSAGSFSFTITIIEKVSPIQTITHTVTFSGTGIQSYTCYLYYDANGGSNAPATQSYTGTSTSSHTFTIRSNTPSRTGYTFEGWATSSSASTASYLPGGTISVPYNGSKTLYAVWSMNSTSYQIGDHLVNETVYVSQTVPISGSTSYSTYAITNRTGTNCTVGSFNIVGANNGFYVEGSCSPTSLGAFSLTLTVQETRGLNQYTYYITFSGTAITGYTCYLYYDANGGSNAPATQSYTGAATSDHTFTISSDSPTYVGYTFIGWDESSSATVAAYQPNDSISVPYNGSKTLYAVWFDNSYQFSIGDALVNGGKEFTQDVAVEGSTSYSTYAITGSTTSNCNVGSLNVGMSSIGFTVTGVCSPTSLGAFSFTLTVQETRGLSHYTYTLTFTGTGVSGYTCYLYYDANGGTDAPETDSFTGTVMADHVFTISDTIPVRTDYAFIGWDESSSATIAAYQPGNTITVPYDGSKTLYAVWSTYTEFEYDLGNKIVGSSITISQNVTVTGSTSQSRYDVGSSTTTNCEVGSFNVANSSDGFYLEGICVPSSAGTFSFSVVVEETRGLLNHYTYLVTFSGTASEDHTEFTFDVGEHNVNIPFQVTQDVTIEGSGSYSFYTITNRATSNCNISEVTVGLGQSGFVVYAVCYPSEVGDFSFTLTVEERRGVLEHYKYVLIFTGTAVEPIGEVWWDNGYINGSITIVFDFAQNSTVTHTMEIPLLRYDGINDDADNIDEFSTARTTLTITNGYRTGITCSVNGPNVAKTYSPVFNSGYWTQYGLTIDVQTGTITFQGISSPYRDPGLDFSFVDYTVSYQTEIYNISDMVKGMAFKQIYHSDSTTGDHPHFQVVNTTTYLNTYGFVMVDPTLNIYERFSNYNNLRLNFYSFAYYGDSITINGRTYEMDGSKVLGFYYIPKGTTVEQGGQVIEYWDENTVCDADDPNGKLLDVTLTNIYVTWTNIQSENEEDRVCYLTFVDEGITINMGTYAAGDLTVSMGGVWYFTTAIYEPYIGYETSYDMDWNSPFNMSKPGFILTFIGVALVSFLILNMFYKPGFIDYIIVAGAGLIAFILL